MVKFELNLRRRNIPREELLDDLKRVANLVNQNTGSWNKALEAAGLKVVLTLNNKEEVLFENLANVWQHLGRQPVGKDLDKANGYSKFSLGTYEGRFGSWNKALQAFVAYIDGSAEQKEVIVENQNTEGKYNQSGRTPRKINWRLRALVLIRDNCICKMCGVSPAKDPTVILHVDHIKSWSKGGETDVDNLRTLCSVCNIGKSNVI